MVWVRPTESIIIFTFLCENKCSQISRNCFIYCPDIQNLVRRIGCSRIWSLAQDYVVLVLLFIPIGWFISTRPKWSCGNFLYQLCTSSQRANRWGWSLNTFAWCTGSSGLSTLHSAVIECSVFWHPAFCHRPTETTHMKIPARTQCPHTLRITFEMTYCKWCEYFF